MTTKDIAELFEISDYQPNRVLSTDAEILKYVKACFAISRLFDVEKYAEMHNMVLMSKEMAEYYDKGGAE